MALKLHHNTFINTDLAICDNCGEGIGISASADELADFKAIHLDPETGCSKPKNDSLEFLLIDPMYIEGVE